MMEPYALFVEPFVAFSFMRRALVACWALAVGGAPIGVLLILRRMSLVGDALSHAVLPGAAIGYLIGGLSLVYLGLGGFVAGLGVALLSGTVSRFTPQREDASYAALHLVALALGVVIVSVSGSSIDLMHLLFGAILAVNDGALLLVTGISTFSTFVLAVIYRPLLVECYDPVFLRAVWGHGGVVYLAFTVLVVLNLVAGFQALGTLMVMGLMMLPAAAARFWAGCVGSLMVLAAVIAVCSGYAGLLLSYFFNLPSGPAIVLVAGCAYAVSVLVGTRDSIRVRHLIGSGATPADSTSRSS